MAQSTKEGRVYTEGSGTYGWSPVKGVPASAVLKPAASGGFRYSMSGAPLGADLGSIRAVRPDPALSRPGERVLPTSPEHVRRERGRQRDSERAHKVHRNKLQERLDNPEHKAAKPPFIGGVDRMVYGKPTAAPSDARAQVDEITKLPARGGWSEKAGVTSKKALLLGMGRSSRR